MICIWLMKMVIWSLRGLGFLRRGVIRDALKKIILHIFVLKETEKDSLTKCWLKVFDYGFVLKVLF